MTKQFIADIVGLINMDIKNAEPLIRKILSEFPETRNDDRELILKVWEAQGLKLSSYQAKLFKRVFSPETIRRTFS